MFYFWRGATAALVPGFLCQSGRRRPENVSILSSLVLHETIRKGDFSRNTVLECWNNVATIRNSQQYVVMLVHCTKNPRCADRHRVTS